LATRTVLRSKLLASASDDMTVELWNPVTGELLQQLKGHTDWVRAVAFSPDGQLLASVSNDMTVKLWNPVTGEPLKQLELNIVVSALSFSMDNQNLETDKGLLYLHSRSASLSSLEPKYAEDIFLNGNWITRNTQNFLWLPHDYRGTCSAVQKRCSCYREELWAGNFHEIQFFLGYGVSNKESETGGLSAEPQARRAIDDSTTIGMRLA
jgi:WD40 repeat protein